MKWAYCLVLLQIISFASYGQEVISLYDGAIPNSKPGHNSDSGNVTESGLIRRVMKPSLEIYLPDKANASGSAVIICPGGSYKVIVHQGEGVSAAREFAKKGVAAFVLTYRLPDEGTMEDKKIGPVQDAQQAVKLVRENAAKWGIDEHKVGIMGFSAGGHLASTEATHFEQAFIQNSKGTNLRPDFQILVYPVISMQNQLTHADSRSNLLGTNPSNEVVDQFSNELQVKKNTPPAYITHAADDKTVDVDNSITYFEKLRNQNVEVEMHIYPKGGHGFIFRQKGWMDPLFEWMKRNNWIKDPVISKPS